MKEELETRPDPTTELGELEKAIANKKTERQRVINLHARGVMEEDEAADHLEGLRREIAALDRQHADLLARQHQRLEVATHLTTATILLEQLQDKVTDVSWETKRQLVEALVAWVRVDTVVVDGKKTVKVTIRYRFDGNGGGSGGGGGNSYTLARGLRGDNIPGRRQGAVAPKLTCAGPRTILKTLADRGA